MTHVVASIDGSRATPAVCDYAAWASQRLRAPVLLFHVLDQGRYPVETDMAGAIGFGAREQLLSELAELDERRSRLALEQGRQLLDAAADRLRAQGQELIAQRQRHGDLAQCLLDISDDMQLLVMGLHGENSREGQGTIGSQLETVIRSMQRPVLLVPDDYREPRSAMLAFDGSVTGYRGVDMLAGSPVFRDFPVHLVMVGADTADRREQIAEARRRLDEAGCETYAEIRDGDVEQVLHGYQEEHNIDLMVMGAYGHSRIRQFLLGSTTTHMLKTTRTPLLIQR